MFKRWKWTIFAVISIAIAGYGYLAIKEILLNRSLTQDCIFTYLELILVTTMYGLIPVAIIAIALSKIKKKIGIYFSGVRIVENGFEFGNIYLDVDHEEFPQIVHRSFFSEGEIVEWNKLREFYNLPLCLTIFLRKKNAQTKQLLLEKLTIFSNEKNLFEMHGHDTTGIHGNNIFALSQGSLHVLLDDKGLYPNDLPLLKKRLVDILSIWQTSFMLTCQIRRLNALKNLNNVMAFGVLGGIDTTNQDKNNSETECQEEVFNSRSL